jgi:hypothetical protein
VCVVSCLQNVGQDHNLKITYLRTTVINQNRIHEEYLSFALESFVCPSAV